MTERITLETPVAALPGVGNVTGKRLAYLDIHTVRDLLWHVPFRYDDLRTVTPIRDVKIGQAVTVHARLILMTNRRSPRRRMHLTEALVEDATGSLSVVWFNQPFLAKTLKVGDALLLSGTVRSAYGRAQLVAPRYEKFAATARKDTLTPVYGATAGLTQKQLRFFVAAAFRALPEIPDPVPEAVRSGENVLPVREALWRVHFPRSDGDRDEGLRRLKFDELLIFQLHRRMQERGRTTQHALPVPFRKPVVQRFVASLPFTLTPWQKKAAWEILQDMERSEPMHRLLEGDVGSGKTVVAAIAAVNALAHGNQVVLMAPTEILARQHFLSLQQLLARESYPIFLWTRAFREHAESGTTHKLSARALAKTVAQHRASLTIGTHALLEHAAEFPNVGLVVVDEQQRFGVGQRATLHQKGRRGAYLPHFLSLSATPIPRTLALAIAGDLKISLITQLPKGRQRIATQIVESKDRQQLYARVDAELERGRQAFVVAPLIAASDTLGAASATELFTELQALLPHRKLGLLHGRMQSAEKNASLLAFARGECTLLVTTAVIEVGIDVPNATMMVIEGAERFGLSQLHQLRGRVGRGEHASSCFLVTDALTPLARKRLEAVAGTNDGFRIAELDLALRGPGDMVGTLQAGFLDFRFASLGDHELIKLTADIAGRILAGDPDLATLPALREVLALHRVVHTE